MNLFINLLIGFMSVFTFTLTAGTDLFGETELTPPEVVFPDYAVEQMESVSGNDASDVPLLTNSFASLEEQILALSESNEALSDEIMALASGSGYAAEAYLSATIIDVMERVVNGRPFCKYVAYRVSYDDTSAGTLVYGGRCEVTDNSITVYNGELIEYYRYRTGSSAQWQYRYTVTPVDSYMVSFGDRTLLYTNCLKGYPTLGFNYTACLILLLVAVVLFFVFRKGD